MSTKMMLQWLSSIKKPVTELDWQNRNLKEGVVNTSSASTFGGRAGGAAFGASMFPGVVSSAQTILKDWEKPYSQYSKLDRAEDVLQVTTGFPAAEMTRGALLGDEAAESRATRTLLPMIAGLKGINAYRNIESASDKAQDAWYNLTHNNIKAAKNNLSDVVKLAAGSEGAVKDLSIGTTALVGTVKPGSPSVAGTFAKDLVQGGAATLYRDIMTPPSLDKRSETQKWLERSVAGVEVGGGVALNLAAGKELQARRIEKAGIEAAEKVAEKAGVKAAEKAGAKSVLKKIPGLAWIPGGIFALGRVGDAVASGIKGDFAGAGMHLGAAGGEVASGVAGSFPGLGTAVSVAGDIGLGAYDVKMAKREAEMEATRRAALTPAQRQAEDKAAQTNAIKKQKELEELEYLRR